MPPTLSVVVGTRNRPGSLARFARSIGKHATVTTELLIGDASDQAGSYTVPILQAVTQEYPLVTGRVFPETPPRSMLRGFNWCFKRSTGRWVSWFNDDCEVLAGWDAASIRHLEDHPQYGLGAVYWRDLPKPVHQVYEFPPGVPHVNFGVMRRELGERIGWFDERLGWGYGSDTAIALAVLQCDLAICRLPGARCDHYREQDEEREVNMRDYHRADVRAYDKHWRHLHFHLRCRQAALADSAVGPRFSL